MRNSIQSVYNKAKVVLNNGHCMFRMILLPNGQLARTIYTIREQPIEAIELYNQPITENPIPEKQTKQT